MTSCSPSRWLPSSTPRGPSSPTAVEESLEGFSDEGLVELCRDIQRLVERQEALARIAEPTIAEVGQLIATRTEVARSAAYAAFLSQRAQALRGTGSARQVRRDA